MQKPHVPFSSLEIERIQDQNLNYVMVFPCEYFPFVEVLKPYFAICIQFPLEYTA